MDRLWPRGVTKSSAEIDFWIKDIAPSTELRKWLGHEPEKLSGLVTAQRALPQRNVTLVHAAKDELHKGAVVLKQVLGRGA